ncbi:MAG: hypothetical protein ACKPDI_14565 [Actinomycetota bacterium]
MSSTNAPHQPHYDIVWPRPPVGVQSKAPAPRPTSLAGKRIGFVWDYIFRGEEIFPILEAELVSRFPGVEIVPYDVFGNIHGGDQAARVNALPHVLAQYRVDAVVCGNGC